MIVTRETTAISDLGYCSFRKASYMLPAETTPLEGEET